MKSTNKDLNKSSRITVRLTPHLDFELNRISKELKVDKAKIVRYFLNDFINKYNNATGK